ncbi:response regulator transcription factor [Ectobacillus panaciterrae]|uniref:response regulator transcription factor n=1 Tax=Ectobacillus panaciterrae TaxID=363872 RepID=UPI000401B847|nr:response regulator transcription factor [Ectobacillus panaciterrae]
MKKILIVEDEKAIGKVLSAYLRKEGFEIMLAENGRQALDLFAEWKPALVLLDVMLPGFDGWELLSRIRSQSSCPVIMLTALGQVEQKLKGFSGGADDYITKPFAPEEVVARVHAILRRPSPMMDTDSVYFGSLKIDFHAHTVSLHGTQLDLLPRDLSLLLFLAKHPNQTLTREQLLDYVWGIEYEGSDRAVDLSIKRLRQVLREWDEEEGEIKTLRGLGYQFSVYK